MYKLNIHTSSLLKKCFMSTSKIVGVTIKIIVILIDCFIEARFKMLLLVS